MSCGRRDENNDICGETYTCSACRTASYWEDRAMKAEGKTRDHRAADQLGMALAVFENAYGKAETCRFLVKALVRLGSE